MFKLIIKHTSITDEGKKNGAISVTPILVKHVTITIIMLLYNSINPYYIENHYHWQFHLYFFVRHFSSLILTQVVLVWKYKPETAKKKEERKTGGVLSSMYETALIFLFHLFIQPYIHTYIHEKKKTRRPPQFQIDLNKRSIKKS